MFQILEKGTEDCTAGGRIFQAIEVHPQIPEGGRMVRKAG